MNAEKPFVFGLLVLSLTFLGGAALGCVLLTRAADSDTLLRTMTEIWSGLQQGSRASFPLAALNVFLYPFAVFLCGFTALGVVLAPVIVAARGFLLSYTVSAFVRTFGTHGLWLAAGSVGATGLLTVPCLFILGLFAFSASYTLLQAQKPMLGAPYLMRFLACSVVLAAAALLETFALPALLQWLAGAVT